MNNEGLGVHGTVHPGFPVQPSVMLQSESRRRAYVLNAQHYSSVPESQD